MGSQLPSDPLDDAAEVFGGVAKGCLLTPLCHLFGIAIVFGILVLLAVLLELLLDVRLPGMVAWFPVFLIGVTQVVYMGPVIYYAYRRGHANVAKGLILGAALTFALSAACWATDSRNIVDFMQNGLRVH